MAVGAGLQIPDFPSTSCCRSGNNSAMLSPSERHCSSGGPMTSPAKRSFAATLAACAVLLPFSAPAADGEVLIDQAAVNAGGITPADSPGFPVTISRRGKYKLSGNLAVPTGVDGLQVTSEDVTIDFNGFTMRSVPPGEARIAISGF